MAFLQAGLQAGLFDSWARGRGLCCSAVEAYVAAAFWPVWHDAARCDALHGRCFLYATCCNGLHGLLLGCCSLRGPAWKSPFCCCLLQWPAWTVPFFVCCLLRGLHGLLFGCCLLPAARLCMEGASFCWAEAVVVADSCMMMAGVDGGWTTS
eukprot:scaffold64255_cov19-Tisochrysis_lutea.AAC.6